ncbi:MAG: hypothetical protein ACYC2I_11785 [Elusimicrobiales bacterium]
MVKANIEQTGGHVKVEVLIARVANDPKWHRLEVATNDGFKWDAPVKIDLPNSDNCGVTDLAPESERLVVKWDGKIVAKEKLTFSGASRMISAKFDVR